MEDHPEIDRRPQPSRGVEEGLDLTQQAAARRGDAVEVGEDALSRLKVFDEEDNQLGVGDVHSVQVACLECSGSGLYKCAEMSVPNFGKVEIQSFSCDTCGNTYNKTRALAPQRQGVEELPQGHGRRLTLRVQGDRDLSREVIVSDGAFIRCGELELSSREGAMSTVEGFLRQVAAKLQFMHLLTDSNGAPVNYGELVTGLVDGMVAGLAEGRHFDFVIEDENDASHIQAFGVEDSQIAFETYPIDDEEEEEEEEDVEDVAHIEECADPSCSGACATQQAGSGQAEAGDDQEEAHLAAQLARLRAQDALSESERQAEQAERQELAEYLNRFAEHVEVQEHGLPAADAKRRANQEQSEALALADLDAMD